VIADACYPFKFTGTIHKVTIDVSGELIEPPRDHRLGLPRQSHHRDHPPAADRGTGPPRQIRQKAGHPPTQPLALAGQLARAVQRNLRTTNPSNDLTTQPQQGPTKTTVETP
jgi:hypothetical protein